MLPLIIYCIGSNLFHLTPNSQSKIVQCVKKQQVALGFISGDREMAIRLKPLSERLDIPVIVTLGAEGSMALYRGQEIYQEAVRVKTIIDTTGCGDSYQAAFTVLWFTNFDLVQAMKNGAYAAAETLGHMGGV